MGCEILETCYARKLQEERLALSFADTRPELYDPDFRNVRLIPGRMAQAARWSDLAGKARPDKPWLDGRPRHIFISDMSDALSEAVPFDYLKREVIDHVGSAAGRRHRWLWLTKRPQRMAEFAAWLGFWPENLSPGTSVTKQPTADFRIPWLLRVPAARRFVSYEPALGPIRFRPEWLAGITQVIIGGESGAGFRQMPIGWVRAAAEDAIAARVRVFVKQDAARQPGTRGAIPDDLWALKEIP